MVGEALPVLKGDNESAQFRGVNFIDGGGKAVVIQKLTEVTRGRFYQGDGVGALALGLRR
jgi:hypothetical protein